MKIELRVEACLVHQGRILLVNHVRDRQSYWVLPGGHVEPGETLPQALQRELFEELSLETSVGALLLVHQFLTPDRHTLNLAFNVSAPHPEHLRLNPGKRLKDSRWVASEELISLQLRPPLADFLRDLLAGKSPASVPVLTFEQA